MDLSLVRPAGLDNAAWAAIDDSRARLERAFTDDDRPLAIGTAKDLAESVARTVLGARGNTVVSSDNFPKAINAAQAALVRQPGADLTDDPVVRTIAQSCLTIVLELPAARNRCGTGHGRAVLPEISAELVTVSVSGAMLWIRWALRRLEALIAGSVPALARDLLEGGIFKKGELAQRLVAADLRNLDEPTLRALGIAVAHRAMNNTFNVQDDGVEACAADPSLDTWPAAYRAGLAEGLLLDRNGYVSPSVWGATHIALVLAAHPDSATILQELREKVRTADWAYAYAGDPVLRTEVAKALAPASGILSNADAQRAVGEIVGLLLDRAAPTAPCS